MPAWITKELIIDVVICLIIFGAGFGLKWKLDEAARATELADQLKAQTEAQAAMDEKAAAWETKRAALEKENKQLKGRVTNETKKAIYHSCIVPPDGVRIYNDALSGTSGGESIGPMP